MKMCLVTFGSGTIISASRAQQKKLLCIRGISGPFK